MNNQISETLLVQDKITDKHLRWKCLKYKIRRFTIIFSKNVVKEEDKDQYFLEKKLKKLEKKKSNVNKVFKIYLKKKMSYNLRVNVTGMIIEKSQLNFSEP